MSKSLVELTAEIVKEQVAITPMSIEETEAFIVRIFNTLKTIQETEQEDGLLRALMESSEKSASTDKAKALDPRDSIRDDKVTCLECGLQFRQITANHLKSHGMTMREYKRKWGFRLKDSLAAKALSASRSAAAKQRGIPPKLKEYHEKKRREKTATEAPQGAVTDQDVTK